MLLLANMFLSLNRHLYAMLLQCFLTRLFAF